MTTTLPEPVAPMLATADEPPSGPGWAFEFKWDGVRAVAAAAGDQVRLYSRNGNDITGGYPELAVLSDLVGGRPVLLDGEIVTLDEAGLPNFALLQQRMHVRAPNSWLVDRIPISYYVFDLLDLDGHRLLSRSYQQRRELLAELAVDGASPRVRVPPQYTDVDGRQLLEVAHQHGLEGVVGKRLTSRYEPRPPLTGVDEDRAVAHPGSPHMRVDAWGGPAHRHPRRAADGRLRRRGEAALPRRCRYRVHRLDARRPADPARCSGTAR
jgi:bifunctional non-homologous end joining protein LigD